MDAALSGARPSPAALASVIAALGQRFGNRFHTSEAVRQQHNNMATSVNRQPPDGVVYPNSTEEVGLVVRLCADARVPVNPY
jgi:D-lactate dehydrogenase (cytochrome)